MAVHHPHLLDFSPPPNTVAMEPPPPSFDHGHLLALHVDGTDMTVGGGGGVVPTHHRVLAADDTAAWPQAPVSLSLYNYNAAGGPSSLFGHHQHQFAVPPAAAVSSLAPTSSMQRPFQLRSSKYLVPVQELLSEFCSLEGDLLHAMNGGVNKRALNGGNKWDDVETSSSSGLWGHPSLSSMDLLELERMKARLLSMVEEVDRRYRRYREQMRAVEVSFEAVAGAGASQVYTRLALRAMSRHFRCLRDALVAQVRALRKAMGERDGSASSPAGATKGDTPRLKVLDQCLRQQRAFQQPGTIENYPWRPQRGLPERAVAVLRAWLFEHFLHPYPNDVDKHILARQTGLSRSQVSNWFINARVRLWKPMIEDMYTEEVKQQSEVAQNPSGGGAGAGAVKPEQQSTTTIGESAFRITGAGNNPTTTSINVTDGGDHHHLLGSYPSLHGSVSLTLGLQQQPFASPMMMMMHGEETEEPVLPYIDLTAGSQFLHDLAG
ncbi:hypothetical protein SEVIR_4G006100v4 [Setaria viridis]|uniref:Homeobox domain-containing protein n=1 Tax=Setaria viridis TaxID=4556 RepID=A0A4U6UY68_SETVI|nr:homeobox protein BEL1 homolog [Setaria viridis]TKW19219.1 hypothetical protein SEVIR_4G006100v2 [Setaria viridis]TKW19220.1 hypothetical protein SEVIR_4G006100v2 [Setaria viridis]